ACPAITSILPPSRLAIEEQDESHRGEAAAPDPAWPAARRRQSHLEPPAPARERAEDPERRVGDLGEELLLQVEHRVRVRQQEPAAHRAQQREHVAARPPRPHWPDRSSRPPPAAAR